ncbi:EAL domain-containing protein [Acidithiobacillus sp. AMEEHan]|uniref:EAL domain-containing protein n=1 Tax=Acidithiobacillus sp. AMEEHan TaxID=2994951 RepID=UPI0027E4B8E5|nr:EAL domain-containing protein [Acidithiobacillus sp. AMEEHan]
MTFESISLPAPILVVEDDSASRALLLRRLSREGWEAQGVADGIAALTWLEKQQAAAILLDIGLPGLTGLEVLARIRSTHTANVLPVLMVTAFDEEDHLAEAFALGANDYVSKPIDFTTLRARLRSCLSLSHSHQKLQQARVRQELILAGANDGIWEWFVPDDLMEHSARWSELLGGASIARTDPSAEWLQRIHPDDRPRVEAELVRFLHTPGQTDFHCEYRMLGDDDRYRWVLTRGAALRSDDGSCSYCAGTHTHISHLRYTNRLTGLPNLLYLTDELARRAVLAGAVGQSEQTLILLQLTNLENFLDKNEGRRAAVAALGRALAQELPSCLVGSGEQLEHLLLLPQPEQGGAVSGENLARRAIAIVNAGSPYFPPCTAVAGVATMTPSELVPSADVLLAAAQAAAQEADALGLGLYRFDDALRQRSKRRRELRTELALAVKNRAFQPWLQPIVHGHGQLVGFEALARWQREDGERVSPAEFIPLLEEAGLIGKLTEQMLDASLPMIREWIQGDVVPADAYVAINFPPGLLDDQLPAKLIGHLRQHGLGPHNLCVEVTESTAVTNLQTAGDCLQRLGKAGFHLALDDFGTGYASLSTLHRLSFDTLKIDQSFVRDFDSQEEIWRMIEAIIAIARALNLKVVAEGVENLDQAEALRGAGVDRLQGYLFAKPMPRSELETWLRANQRKME